MNDVLDGHALLRHGRTIARPSRVVVLGAGGFIGKALVSRLSAQEIPVVAPSRSEFDLAAPDSVGTLVDQLRPDDTLVFASASTPEKGRDAATFMRNITMGYHVGSAVERRPCAHVVYLSSVAVYGQSPDTQVSERTPPDPDDLYGVMHLTREKLLRCVLAATRVPLAVLRLSNVYGTGDSHASYGPNRFMREIEQRGCLTLFGAGEELRDHVYVDDVVGVILSTIARRSEGLVNVATGRSVSFATIADIFDQVVGEPVPRATRARSVPLMHLHYDVTLLRQAFPELVWTSMADGVARVVAARKAMCGRA